nr:PAS domain S-box protein [Candidatus Delongbacteria bacterium]
MEKNISILIIEDNPGDALLIKEMFREDKEYIFEHCVDLDTALEKIEVNTYDITLVDLGLPGCVGTEAPMMIMNEIPNLPIIVLTGSDDPIIIKDLLNVGIQDYLIKGNFDKETLTRSIRYSIERARVFQELKMEKYFADNIINTAHAIVLVLDIKGNILSMNKFLEDLTDYHYNEVKNKNWFELFIPEDIRGNIEEIFNTIWEGDLKQGHINPIIKKNGDKVFIEWFYSIMRDEKNEIIGVLNIGHDVSQIRETEKTLIESETKFRNLAENTSVAILMYQDDYWVYANSFAIKTTGYTNEELMKLKFWEFVHPDYQEKIKMLGQKRQEHEEADDSYEFKVITKNNETKWVWLSGTSCMHNGKPAGLISVMDITKRKTAEKELLKLSTAVEQSPSIVVMTDTSGDLIYANPIFSKITGYTFEEVKNQNPRILKSGDMDDNFYTDL